MEWLTPDKETEFVVNGESLTEKIKLMQENKTLVDSLKGLKTDVEKRNMILSGINSVALDSWSERQKMPPYSQSETKEYLGVVSDYVSAQEQLFAMLEKEPFIYPDMLPPIHRTLVGRDEDIPAIDKGCFRSRYSGLIQTPYFDAVSGSKVASEMAYAFMQYGFISGDTEKDISNIAKLHAQIVRIQPFMCANKRMAFLVTNAGFKLMGLSPITLCKTQEESEAYLGSLKEAILNRDATQLADFFLEKQLQAQQDQIDEATLEAVEVSKNTNLSV